MSRPRAIDLFCGVGGSSWGARSAGVEIIAGFDMWPVSQAVYCENFKSSRFYPGKLEDTDPQKIASELGNIDLILASPECTNHSPAKGNKPRCDISKDTAFQVIRFAKAFQPRWIVIENVVNMKKWHRFNEFFTQIKNLGYNTGIHVLNAADFGVPQARKRLFILCDREKQPNISQPENITQKSAKTIINSNGLYPFSPLRIKKRAKPTLERAERAITALGNHSPFLIVYYGSDRAGGWQSLESPLRTITTLDRFAYVRPNNNDHEMRMLQPEELKAAMSMPKNFKIEQGNRRDKIKLIGNAVCPAVMQKVVSDLISEKTCSMSA